MDAETLEIVRLRYKAAYDAYQERARRVAQRLERGEIPAESEIADEAKALGRLTNARQELMEAMAKAEPP